MLNTYKIVKLKSPFLREKLSKVFQNIDYVDWYFYVRIRNFIYKKEFFLYSVDQEFAAYEILEICFLENEVVFYALPLV